MDSLTIIVRRAQDADLVERFEMLEAVSQSDAGVWVLERGGSRIYLAHDDFAHQEPDPASLAQISAELPDPLFYNIDLATSTYAKTLSAICCPRWTFLSIRITVPPCRRQSSSDYLSDGPHGIGGWTDRGSRECSSL